MAAAAQPSIERGVAPNRCQSLPIRRWCFATFRKPTREESMFTGKFSSSPVREVSENWWYTTVFRVKCGKWGDRKPLRILYANLFHKSI